jgi:hypothetical protein
MVPGSFCGGAGEEEGEETSGFKNKTHLLEAGPPGRKPGGLRRRGSAPVQALRRLTATTSSRDPTRMVKEQGCGAEPRGGRRRAAEGVG